MVLYYVAICTFSFKKYILGVTEIYFYTALSLVTLSGDDQKRETANRKQLIIRMHTCKCIIYLYKFCNNCNSWNFESSQIWDQMSFTAPKIPQVPCIRLDSGPYVSPQKGNAIWLTFTYTCVTARLRALRTSFPNSPSSPGERCSAVSILRVGAVEMWVLSVMLLRLIVVSHRGEPCKVIAIVLSAIIRQPLQSSARFPVP